MALSPQMSRPVPHAGWIPDYSGMTESRETPRLIRKRASPGAGAQDVEPDGGEAGHRQRLFWGEDGSL